MTDNQVKTLIKGIFLLLKYYRARSSQEASRYYKMLEEFWDE